MKKEGKSLLFKISMFLIVLSIIEIAVFLFTSFSKSGSISGNVISETGSNLSFSNIKLVGNSIKSSIGNGYSGLSSFAKIFLLAQWFALFIVSYFVLFKKRPPKDLKNDSTEIVLDTSPGKKKTDLDLLYEFLQDKKELRISTICKVFKVNKEIAMGWCKILESGNLVAIDYPGFGEPIIRIPENKNKDNKRETK